MMSNWSVKVEYLADSKLDCGGGHCSPVGADDVSYAANIVRAGMQLPLPDRLASLLNEQPRLHGPGF